MSVFFHDGFIYKISPEENFSETNFVTVDGLTTRFRKADTSSLRSLDINLLSKAGQSGENWLLEKSSDSFVHFGTDFTPEYSLEGTPTIYVECEPQPGLLKLTALNNSGAPRHRVRSQTSYLFSALSACHRCNAYLRLEFFDETNRKLASHSLELKAAPGGRKASDFHASSIDVRPPEGACEAEVSLIYGEPIDQVDNLNSFIFIAKTELSPKDGMIVDDLVDRSLEACVPTEPLHLFRAPLDFSRLASDQSAIHIGDLNGSEEVIASWLGSEATSYISIEHQGSNRFTISNFDIDRNTIFVDGRRIKHDDFVFVLGQNEIYLDPSFCDGEFHRLDVRDSKGCFCLQTSYALLPFMQTPWPLLQEHARLPPQALSPLAGQRYNSLLAHVANGRAGVEPRYWQQIEQAHAVLVRGFVHNKSFPKLSMPFPAAPIVSIVVPVHNKFEVTYYCLCALIFAYVDTPFEVIVVDDGSSDRTRKLQDYCEGIVYIRNETGQGFINACNKGAKSCRGKYVVLLNNDTEPAYRWLDELLFAFDTYNRVGLAGSRLLYPDGRLQEAGGIVWGSGNPWNYGRLANPFDPRFSYTRDADYLSGAAIMLPTHLWTQLGGFSEEFVPAYFEDTDLAFQVRDAGYRTLFVALSDVYHFEGISSGTDVTKGVKKHQETNRPRFKRKWRRAYEHFGREGVAPDLEKDRGVVARALFFDYSTPRLNFDAGSHAALQEMRLFQALGYKVTFCPQNLAYLGDHTAHLQRIGIEVVHGPFFSSCQELLKKRGSEFDVVYITRYNVAKELISDIRSYAPQAKILFCNADLHFLRYLRSATAQKNKEMMDEALKVRSEELAVMNQVDVVLSYSDVEPAVILSHNLDRTLVMRLPWVEHASDQAADIPGRAGMAFLGSFNHHPNAEAVIHFVGSIMPHLRLALPGVSFHVFGSNVTEAIEELAADDVVIHGYVESLDDVFAGCRVFVAPLLSGAGIKGKVLAALSRGVPCVLSPIAAEGVGLRHGYDCMIAERPEQWRDAIGKLTNDDEFWRFIGGNGRNFVKEAFSFEGGLDKVRRILDAMDLPYR